MIKVETANFLKKQDISVEPNIDNIQTKQEEEKTIEIIENSKKQSKNIQEDHFIAFK